VDSGEGSPVGVEPVLESVDGGGLHQAVRQVVPGADMTTLSLKKLLRTVRRQWCFAKLQIAASGLTP
jgi:hypothetical protein